MHGRDLSAPRALFGFLLTIPFAIAGCGRAPITAPMADQVTSASEIARSEAIVPQRGSTAVAARAHTTLDELWPNDDGRFWRYAVNEVVFTEFPQLHYYENREAVPPAPSLLELAQWLKSHRRDELVGVGTASGTWILHFRGQGTTSSGAQGQNLAQTLIPDALGARAARRVASVTTASENFLASLARARPDLAPALRERFPDLARVGVNLAQPILIHGYIWEKTAEHIGTYGDADLQLAWKFLEADISSGHAFTFQLVPSLASDVWLHALVLPARFASHPQPAPGAVQVLYVIDYGISWATDANGDPVGFFRIYSYGTVTYAPGVGPVASVEHNFLSTGGTPAEVGFEIDVRLTETGVEAALAAAYRDRSH